MKKKKYSLTAKERKELRKGKVTEAEKVKTEPVEAEEGVVAPKSAVSYKRITLIAAVILLGILLITTAILVPILFNKYRYNEFNNPVARMELSNGMVLEFEIFEDTCPIAATNFIFLARIGYFDNTIIFDIQNNWVRFGGYETETKHRSTNSEFCEKVEGIDSHPSNKFGYKLKADTSSDASMYEQAGVLNFMYNDTATEFQVAAINGAQLNIQTPTSNKEYKVVSMGRAVDDTLENIKTIAGMAKKTDSASTIWKPPAENIVIKKVKMYNLDKKKWKNFVFDDYFADYTTSWTSA